MKTKETKKPAPKDRLNLSNVATATVTATSLESSKEAQAIYLRYSPEVLAICGDIVGEADKAAAASEAWVVITELMSQAKHPDDAKPYIRLSAIQAAETYVRNRKKRARPLLAIAKQLEQAPKIAFYNPEREMYVSEALNLIPPANRQVVVMRVIEGYEAAETATILAISEEEEASLYTQGLEQLKKVLLDGKTTFVSPSRNQPVFCQTAYAA